MTNAGAASLNPLQKVVYYLLCTSYFLVPFVRLGSLGAGVQLSDAIFALAAAAWGIGLLRGDFRLALGKTLIPLALYAGIAVLSLFATPALGHSIFKLVGLGFLLTIYAITASVASTPLGWRLVVGSWVAGACLNASLGTLSAALFFLGVKDRAVNIFLWGYGSIPVGNYPRVSVLFLNSNMMCNYVLVGVGATMAYRNSLPARFRKYLYAFIPMMSITALFSLSAGLGGLALGGAVGWILWHRYEKRIVPVREALVALGGVTGAVIFLVASIFLFVPRGQGDVGLGPVDLQMQTSGRVSVWVSGTKTILAKPLLGTGIGELVSTTTHPRALHSMEHWGSDKMAENINAPHKMEAHNIWINIGGQLGLPGLAVFIAFVVLLLQGSLPQATDSKRDAWVRISLFSAVVGAVFYQGLVGAFEDSRQYWFLFGLVMAAKARPAEEPAVESTPARGLEAAV